MPLIGRALDYAGDHPFPINESANSPIVRPGKVRLGRTLAITGLQKADHPRSPIHPSNIPPVSCSFGNLTRISVCIQYLDLSQSELAHGSLDVADIAHHDPGQGPRMEQGARSLLDILQRQ